MKPIFAVVDDRCRTSKDVTIRIRFVNTDAFRTRDTFMGKLPGMGYGPDILLPIEPEAQFVPRKDFERFLFITSKGTWFGGYEGGRFLCKILDRAAIELIAPFLAEGDKGFFRAVQTVDAKAAEGLLKFWGELD